MNCQDLLKHISAGMYAQTKPLGHDGILECEFKRSFDLFVAPRFRVGIGKLDACSEPKVLPMS